MKTHWTHVGVLDGDAASFVDEETLIQALREFRETGGVSGLFLTPTEEQENLREEAVTRCGPDASDEERSWAAARACPPERWGPEVAEVDWSGFPEL